MFGAMSALGQKQTLKWLDLMSALPPKAGHRLPLKRLLIREAVRALGLDVRSGVHTGECELVGKGLAGITLHIGARVSALAGSGEILVTQTVRDLVAGSGLSFNERGKHRLKGVPDEWRLFEAVLD